MKQFVIYLLGLIFWLAAPAASAQKQVADSLYAAEKFQQAAAEYEKLLKESDNAELYYNLGNAYYRLHDIGHAILNYEKASNREPGDADIRFNLTLARSKTIDKIESTEDFFLFYWIRSMINIFNADQWGKMAIASFVGLLACVLLYFFGRRMLVRKLGFGIGVAFLVCVLIFNEFAYIQRCQYLDNTHAIVMQTSKVRSTPSNGGTELFQLHEGTKVKILDNTMRDWLQVRLSDGKTGWIPLKNIEII